MRKTQNAEFTQRQQGRRIPPLAGGLAVGIGLLSLGAAPAKADPPAFAATTDSLLAVAAPGSYTSDMDATEVRADDTASGPIRMVRFSDLKGDVTWRGGTEGDWASAARNMPLRQGAQIWVSDNSRAELQFDDGSRLRLDSDTLVTLQTLYSDTQGEFTEITVNEGRVALHLRTKYSTYQVNTPLASVKAAGPARLRIDTGDSVQVAVRQGDATVEGDADRATLHAGDYLRITDNATPYTITDLPNSDDWERWNDARDQEIEGLAQRPAYHYLPSNVALCAGDLDTYGSWHSDPAYGMVWVPYTTQASWRPYYNGHWTWVEPFGWTWVSNEPWGWAPYHYGTWVHAPYGWAWVPGPSTQYWSPAVVTFYQSDGQVAWCPLAPREVRYPSRLSVGFRPGNWSLFFSAGGAAVYYPTAQHICVARPWASTYVNHVTYVTNVTNIRKVTINRNTYITNYHFASVNARSGGRIQANVREFAGPFHGERASVYHPVARETAVAFLSHAQIVGAPVNGKPVAGPQAVPVTRTAFAPTHSLSAASVVPAAALSRSVYRAAVPPTVTHSAPLAGQRFHTAAAPNVRPVERAVPPAIRQHLPQESVNRPPTGAGIVNHPTAPPVHRSSGLDAYLRDRDRGHQAPTVRVPAIRENSEHRSVGMPERHPTAPPVSPTVVTHPAPPVERRVPPPQRTTPPVVRTIPHTFPERAPMTGHPTWPSAPVSPLVHRVPVHTTAGTRPENHRSEGGRGTIPAPAAGHQ